MSHLCPVCLHESARVQNNPSGRDALIVECPRCGDFSISRTLAHSDIEQAYGPRYLLSASLRNRYEQGNQQSTLLTNTVENLLDIAREPSDPFDSMDLLVQHIANMSGGPGKGVKLNPHHDFPLVFARDEEEFRYCITKAFELDFIESGRGASEYRLGLEGWRRLEKIRESNAESDQAFVAMWFSDELERAWKEGFRDALKACGYRPFKIDLQEHNEKICDRIIAEIRKSGLLVADFTGQRGGVYFEAGFAMGLEIPVIWTCRKDDVENLHFDTRQYNHIVWSDSADLRVKLQNRVEATAPNI